MHSSLRGFTLIELMLSLAILAVMTVCVSMFLVFSYQNRVRTQVMAEVDQQGMEVAQLIAQTIRNADTITSPVAGVSGASLTLTLQPAASSPTVFDLTGGALRITEGTGSAVALTSTKVTASMLTFQNVTRASTPGMVRYQFTLTYTTTVAAVEYVYRKTFTGSAALRQP